MRLSFPLLFSTLPLPQKYTSSLLLMFLIKFMTFNFIWLIFANLLIFVVVITKHLKQILAGRPNLLYIINMTF